MNFKIFYEENQIELKKIYDFFNDRTEIEMTFKSFCNYIFTKYYYPY